MKKLIALLLAMVMALSLAACGGGEEETEKSRKEKATGEETEPEKELEGEELELDLFTLVYDEEVWTLDEESMDTNDTWSKVVLTIPDGDDYETYVDIWASGEGLEDFRDYLKSYGFDAQEYVDGKYSTVEIGGVEFLEYETEYWGEPVVYYVARVEGAYTTIHMEIQGEYSEEVDILLEGLEFTLKDTGSKDGKKAYYHCSECEKDFEDAMARIPIENIDTWGVLKGQHKWDENWSYSNKKGHAHNCLNEGCKDHDELQDHELENGKCTICGYGKEKTEKDETEPTEETEETAKSKRRKVSSDPENDTDPTPVIIIVAVVIAALATGVAITALYFKRRKE